MKKIFIRGFVLCVVVLAGVWYFLGMPFCKSCALNTNRVSKEHLYQTISTTTQKTPDSSAQHSGNADNPLVGKYEAKNGSGGYVEVKEEEGNKISLTGYAFWGHGDGGPNIGELDVVTAVENGKAHWESKDYYTGGGPCVIDFTFSNNTLHVDTQNVLYCGWGFNVDFAGDYTRK